MKRSDVNNHINDERDYQELRWSKRNEEMGIPDDQKPVAEWINYMEFHISKAKNNIYHLNKEEALAEIRKVTALGVKCMEIHGCPRRVIPKDLLKENLK